VTPTKKLVKYALVACGCNVYDYEVKEIIESFRFYKSKKRTEQENFVYSLCKALCKVRCYHTKEEFEEFLYWVGEGVKNYHWGKANKKILRIVKIS
jgi:hypothetical protein